jgi:hypothetical protein
MKLLISTVYEIIKDDGESFNEVVARTEVDIPDKETIPLVLEIHEEKVGRLERIIRTQLKDLLNDKI